MSRTDHVVKIPRDFIVAGKEDLSKKKAKQKPKPKRERKRGIGQPCPKCSGTNTFVYSVRNGGGRAYPEFITRTRKKRYWRCESCNHTFQSRE